MALPSSLTIAVKFDRTTIRASFKISDTTDYTGLGLDSTLVKGVFRIVDPNGNTIHNNNSFTSPDINGAVTLQYSGLALPLDINGNIVQGKYTFYYSIKYDSAIVYVAPTAYATYSDIFPEIAIEVEVDCFCGLLESIDATSYGPTAIINERTHTVVYPAALNISDIVSQNAVVTVSPIYTQTWTTIIETNLTYTLPDGSTVDVILTGSKETVVDCDLSLCQISCCLLALNNRYINARTTNPVDAGIYLAALNRAVQLVQLFRMAQECSQTTAAANALTEIRQVADCTEGCGCGDDTIPQQIIPLCSSGGGSNITVVAGTGITVTTSTVGGSVQYSVAISTAVMNIINSLAPVNVVAGTGISVVKTTPGGVDTYTITNTSTFDPTSISDANCLLEWSNFANPSLTITVSNTTTQGQFADVINVTNTTGSIGVGTWKFQNNLFTVDGFIQGATTKPFKPFVTATLLESQDINGNVTVQTDQYTSSQPFDIRILDVDYTANTFHFDFQFVDKTSGNPITNFGMVYNYKVLVNILIMIE